MVQIIFEFHCEKVAIPCTNNEKFEEIIKRYLNTIKSDNNSNLIFIYRANQINKNLKVEEIVNEENRNRGIANVLVFSLERNNENDNEGHNLNIIKSIDNLFSTITQMKNKINEFEKYIYLVEVLKLKIEKIENELNGIKSNLSKSNILDKNNSNNNMNDFNIFNNNNVGKINSSIKFAKGMIMAWFGQSYDIPEDWAICDGRNGTPDLRNRFIIGVSNEIEFSSTGGRSFIQLSKTNLPKMGTCSFSADSHRGACHHSSNGLIKYNGSYSTFIKGSDHGDDWGSNWTIDLNKGMNSTPIDITNPYFALFYIMKL